MYFRFCGLRHVALNVYEFHSPARSLSGNLQRGLIKFPTDPHREHTPDHFGVYERMNEYFIHQHSKNSKEQNCVDWTESLKRTYNCPKRYVNEETHCTKTKR